MSALRRTALATVITVATVLGMTFPAQALGLTLDLRIIKIGTSPAPAPAPTPAPAPAGAQSGVTGLTGLLGPIDGLLSGIVEGSKSLLTGLIPSSSGLKFTWRTTYQPASGAAVVKNTTGVLNLPMGLNADGKLGDEFTAKLKMNSDGTVGLDITRNLLAASKIPASVVAVLTDKSGQTLEVGYDARSTYAPKSWTATIGLAADGSLSVKTDAGSPGTSLTTVADAYGTGTGGTKVDPMVFRMTTTPVPGSLQMTVGLTGASNTGMTFTSSAATKLDIGVDLSRGQDVRHLGTTIDMLPKSAALNINGGVMTWTGAAPVGSFSLDTSLTSAGVPQQSMHFGVTGLQRATTLDFSTGDEQSGLDWSADATTSAVNLVLDNPAASGAIKHTELAMTSVPKQVHFGLDSTTGEVGVTTPAGGVLGSFLLRLEDGNAPSVYEDLAGGDGFVMVGTSSRIAGILQLTNVRTVTLDTADEDVVHLAIDETTPRRFTVRTALLKGVALPITDIVFDKVQPQTTVDVTRATGAIEVTSSARTGQFDVFLTSGNVLQRSTTQLSLTDLPTLVSISPAASQDEQTVVHTNDTTGPGIGLLRVTTTNRLFSWPGGIPEPGAAVPDGDGLIISDQSALGVTPAADRHTTVGMRVHGLRSMEVGGGEPLKIDSTGGKRFSMILTRYNGDKDAAFTHDEVFPVARTFDHQEFYRIRIDKVQPHTSIQIGDDGAVEYRADNATDSLRYENNLGNKWMTTAEIGGGGQPLPKALDICFAVGENGGACSDASETVSNTFKQAGDGYEDETTAGTSMAIVASEKTRVNFLLCLTPVNNNCHEVPGPDTFPTPGESAGNYVWIDNLVARRYVNEYRISVRARNLTGGCTAAILRSCLNAGHYYVDTDNQPVTGKVETRVVLLRTIHTYGTESTPFAADNWFTKWKSSPNNTTGVDATSYDGPGVVKPNPCPNATVSYAAQDLNVFNCTG